MSRAALPLEESLLATTLELVRVPSVTGHEAPLCDAVQARVAARLPQARVLRFRDTLVVWPWARRPDRPLIGLFGHLDTVPDHQDGPVRVEAGRIHGCGVSDMKSGLAVMLELLERLGPDDTRADLCAVFYEAEEGPYDANGLQPLLEATPELTDIDLAFCLEPSDNKLQLGCLGGIHCTLTYSGRRAHSARPWQGENAVHKAGALLSRLAERQRLEVRFGDLAYYEVMSITMVEAVGARNVVPDRFAMNLNYRFAPGRSLEEAKRDIEVLTGGECEITWTDLSPSGPVCRDNPLLAPLLSDPAVPHEPKQAWTDVARLALFGIDAVNLGPGESAQAHQRDESCGLAQIIDGYRLFERYLRVI
ncbi:MAG: succinyl-diaminopimelate desuccinylase [Deltaproteobacteria bacterium]|nr:succinyl-diaminopimelate desuccinylase [Deltaproteobacteria bacterium]MCB9788696.1 succinyl-diaminopimelate desuccinylase [Deltaproteobacteria bacterium]